MLISFFMHRGMFDMFCLLYFHLRLVRFAFSCVHIRAEQSTYINTLTHTYNTNTVTQCKVPIKLA